MEDAWGGIVWTGQEPPSEAGSATSADPGLIGFGGGAGADHTAGHDPQSGDKLVSQLGNITEAYDGAKVLF